MERILDSIYSRNKNPYKALIEFTHKCNLRCKHCYISNRDEYISLAEAYKIIDVLYDKGFVWLIFSGGEIFLYPYFCEVYRYAKRKGFIIDIKTNCLLLDNEIKEVFLKFPPRKLDISVYGLSNDEYADFTGDSQGFDKLEKSLDWLLDNKFVFQMIIMAIKDNFTQISNGEYSAFFEKYNCRLEFEYDILQNQEGKIMVELLQPSEIAKIELNTLRYSNEIAKAMEKMGDISFECIGGKKSIFIDANAKVHMCMFDDFSVTIDEYDKNDDLRYRSKLVDNLFLESECSNCKKRLGCTRCPLRRKNTKRNGNNNWRCELADARLEGITNVLIHHD